MSFSLVQDGFEIHRCVIPDTLLEQLRDQADSVASTAGSACVRHLRSRSPIFDDLATSETFLSLIPEGLRPVRSILFDKTPDENWPVAWHQDLTISLAEERDIYGYGPWSRKDGVIHVQPPVALLENMVTIRLHLDDTPSSNGALRVIPGSHRHGRLVPDSIPYYTDAESVVCECMPGDILLMHPLLLHSSLRSSTPLRRRVVHIEYASDADLDSALEWFEAVGLRGDLAD